jgi:hypothetical protein
MIGENGGLARSFAADKGLVDVFTGRGQRREPANPVAEQAMLLVAAISGGAIADSVRALIVDDGERVADHIAKGIDVGQDQRARAEAGEQDDRCCDKARARALAA